ncbi:MAG: PIN domain-containing protein [Thermoplasmata archaeon]|nr:PIN domain-containing protein [Thermoplasmata archaeon]
MGLMKLLIDTNVFVAILNKERDHQRSKEVLDRIHQGEFEGATSVICAAEILSGFYSAGEEERGDRFLLDLRSIGNFALKDVSLRIAKEAASLRGRYGTKLPDAIIAATCKCHGYILVTRDESFRKTKEIEVRRPEEV